MAKVTLGPLDLRPEFQEQGGRKVNQAIPTARIDFGMLNETAQRLILVAGQGTFYSWGRLTHITICPPKWWTTPVPDDEVIRFRTYWEGGDFSDNLIMSGHIRRMLTASVELHWKPGINPHNGMKAVKAARMTICRQADVPIPKSGFNHMSGAYWWSTPGLQDNGDPAGAVVFLPMNGTLQLVWSEGEITIWECPAS